MLRHIHYNADKTKRLYNYYCIKNKQETMVIIKFKYNCTLCDLYTNYVLVYKRHLKSNNHYIRSHQF